VQRREKTAQERAIAATFMQAVWQRPRNRNAQPLQGVLTSWCRKRGYCRRI